MNLDWILSPLTMYGVVALALLACAILSLGTKLELGRLRHANAESHKTVGKKIEELEKAVSKIGEQAMQAQPGGPIRHSINLTKRSQVLRMSRRGESVESITAAVAVPRNEIELLLKVQDLVEARRN